MRGHELVRDLIDAFGDEIESVSFGKPTLEDVFVHLTGHQFFANMRRRNSTKSEKRKCERFFFKAERSGIARSAIHPPTNSRGERDCDAAGVSGCCSGPACKRRSSRAGCRPDSTSCSTFTPE